MGDDSDKELARALKIMGAPWVAQVCEHNYQFFLNIYIYFPHLNRSSRGNTNVFYQSLYTNYQHAFGRFMTRALATEMFDFADEADEPEATCPVCKDCEFQFLETSLY